MKTILALAASAALLATAAPAATLDFEKLGSSFATLGKTIQTQGYTLQAGGHERLQPLPGRRDRGRP